LGFKAKNYSIKSLLSQIWLDHRDGIFIDNSGILGNIDINLKCFMLDLNEVKKALQENGLDLIEAKKEMSVLVIKDIR